jgi:hypothetical protein
MKLDNTVEIAGEEVTKERFGLAAQSELHRTFTGKVLFEKDLSSLEANFEKSVEGDFNRNAAVAEVDGVEVCFWKSNGGIPFSDMLLDFVQIGKITWETAFNSVKQRQEEDSETLTIVRDGETVRLEANWEIIDFWRNKRLATIGE